MQGGPVVTNNTPLVAFWELDRFDIFHSLFGVVLVPGEVHREFLARDREARQAALNAAPWLSVVHLADPGRADFFAGLDRGEQEVLALAEERDARLVLVDERKARIHARRRGIPLGGTLGTLLSAKEAGLIDRVRDPLERLRRAGLHLGPSLIVKTLELAGE